jgi:hypothetical protein
MPGGTRPAQQNPWRYRGPVIRSAQGRRDREAMNERTRQCYQHTRDKLQERQFREREPILTGMK